MPASVIDQDIKAEGLQEELSTGENFAQRFNRPYGDALLQQ